MAVLTPVLTGGNGKPTYNLGIAETYSWIPIQNDQNRPIYARAGYITNLNDLQISLSASNLNIGTVHLQDGQDGSLASVVQAGTKYALLVQNQDLISTIDSITIGDNKGNLATVTASSLNVNITNVNALTGNLATSINQIVTNTFLNSVTANQAITNTFLNSVTANQATAINQVTTNTFLNSVTANQATQVTLEKTLSANSVYGTLSSQPLYTTTTNIVTAVQILNPGSLSATILNPSIEISNDVGNAVPVTITNTLSTTPVGTQLVTFGDGPQLDGNHRLRVALPSQNWWYVSSVDKDGDLRLIETTTNGASSIFVQNIASVTMTPGVSSNGSIIRASRRRFKVRPGVSHQWTGTVNFDGQDDGTIKRLGLFTNYNGMFFELSGADFNVVVRRRLTDGTLAEERVNRNNFNGDKLDGNGPSGQNWSTVLSGSLTAGTNRWIVNIPNNNMTVYNTEFTYSTNALSAIKPGTKFTISGVTPSGYNGTAAIAAINTTTNKLTATYTIDPGVYSSVSNATIFHNRYHNAHTLFFEFNGGRTSVTHFGIDASAGPTYLHTFDFSNTLGLQYESAPALMDRKEIFNYKALSYNPSMTIDGTTFVVEAESELNPAFVASYNITPITLAAGIDQPVLGIGLRAGEPYQRSDLQVQQVNIIDTANRSNKSNSDMSLIQWKLLLNPGLSGVPAPTNIGKSSRQWAYTATTGISAQGIELMSGFAISQALVDVKTALNFLNMGSNIDYSDADKLVLTARLISAGSNTTTLVGTINAIEAL